MNNKKKKGKNERIGFLESFSDNDKLIFARTRVRKACKLILEDSYLDRILRSLKQNKLSEELETTPSKAQQVISKIKAGILNLCIGSDATNKNRQDLLSVCDAGVYKLNIPLAKAGLNNAQFNMCTVLARDILSIGIRSKKDKYKDLALSVIKDADNKNIIVSFMLV